MNLIRTVFTMREEGQDMSGFDLKMPPRMYIGAATNPFADPFEFRVIQLAKKIEAGADFIQTQCVYNMDRFKEWMRLAREEGLTDRVHILAGVTPIKSAGMARYMAKRVAGVPKEKAAEEGIKICLETIAELREIEGVRGVHIMAIEWEEVVGEIVESSGLMPRP